MTDTAFPNADAAAPAAAHKPDCLFCRIVRGEIPARKAYEDDVFVAFHDISPAAPVHLLMVPRFHVENLYDADLRHQAMLGHMLGTAGRLAREQGCEDGFRVVINNGRVGRQEVYHLRLHLMRGTEPLGSGPLRR